MQIYKEFLTAKNGSQIPVFLSGRTMESRYNPERDCQNLLDSISESGDFFLVLGAGSGIFIKLLSIKFPAAKIICLELYKEDLDFLSKLKTIAAMRANPNVIFSSLGEIENILIQNYLPAKYSTFKIIEQKGWVNENKDFIAQINSVLQKTLGIISADFSVQAHFGKIWNSNILNNSRLAEKCNSKELFESIKNHTDKTAVIVGAGPSLDKSLEIINKKNRSNYFVIATDTAGHALLKRNIQPDVIISIDAQSVSYNHFINHKAEKNNTLYAFDLCSNWSAAKHICDSTDKVFFFTSGHPLAGAINISNGKALPELFSGAGTVTITALDLAVQTGFTDILVLGADFSYSNGKAYTAGTYLDALYNSTSSKLSESEKTFTKLMFRTELLPLQQDKKTTAILKAYRTSFENYLSSKKISFEKSDDIYKLHCSAGLCNSGETGRSSAFSLTTFMKKLSASDINEAETLLLPYVAWLRNSKDYKDLPYKDLLKLALDSIVSYNI